MYKKLFLGPPGTGKTARLLSIVEDKLKTIAPEKIGFVSFTKKAVTEARDRAADKFNLPYACFTNFKTLHAIAYRELGLNNNKVCNNDHLKKIGELLGYKITGQSDFVLITELGDKLLFLESFSRLTKTPLKELWEQNILDVSWFELKRFHDTYNQYKKHNYVIDFTDMLSQYITQCEPLNIDMVLIDEAQDLSPLQWDMVWHMVSRAKEVYIAGDDDQAVYEWSGADIKQFLSLQVDDIETLPISHRLPENIFNFANEINQKIKHRYQKTWEPKKSESKGLITYHNTLKSLDFNGNWLILARTNQLVLDMAKKLKAEGYFFWQKDKKSIDEDHLKAIQGYVACQKGKNISGQVALLIKQFALLKAHVEFNGEYSQELLGITAEPWYEVFKGISIKECNYYRELLRKGIDLKSDPVITINTIHGSKGGEEDNVLIITDLAKKNHDVYMRYPDTEHRIFYVAVTRAKKELHILKPQSNLYYHL